MSAGLSTEPYIRALDERGHYHISNFQKLQYPVSKFGWVEYQNFLADHIISEFRTCQYRV